MATRAQKADAVQELLKKELQNPGTIHQLLRSFEFAARDKQRIPSHDPRIWVLQAGRAFGKTWTGAHWCRQRIEQGCKHILAIGPTATDVHDVMVPMLLEVLEGAVYRKTLDSPVVMYKDGTIHLRSGQRIDRCRGLNVGGVWADEIDSWKPEQHTPKDAWLAVIEPTCRLEPARFIITSTPKRGGLLSWMATRPDVFVTRGHSRENSENLADGAIEAMQRAYAGSWLERQELSGEIVEDIEGALVTLDMIDRSRVDKVPDDLRRIVVGVDPSGGADEQGIGVAACDHDTPRHYYVLEDATCRLKPDGWGRRAIQAYDTWDADKIVAEKNYGGDMVSNTIQTVQPGLAVKLVNATRAKHVRFEPIASLYAQGRIHHVGHFPKLENEITAFTALKYEGIGSPNRADAVVWAISELMGRKGPSPRDLYGSGGLLRLQ